MTNDVFRIIITDLDGSLLDHETYDYTPALPILRLLREKGIPVVFCSSKTVAEILHLRREVQNTDPFIVENGGAIYIPRHSFGGRSQNTEAKGSYQVISLGRPVAELRELMERVTSQLGLRIERFEDMTVERVCEETGLPLEQARRSLQREYDLPFRVKSSQANLDRLGHAAKKLGLCLTKGGRYFHLTGQHDKGRGVRILIDWYRRQRREAIQTIGIGDSLNDLGLLREVDLPIVIPNPQSGVLLAEEMPTAQIAPLPGPAGWKAAVTAILEDRLNS